MNPVDFYKQAGAKITSPYGMRKHPITGKNTMHWGIDIDYPGPSQGRVWTSPYPGIVTHLGEHGARGKVAVVRIQGTRILQIFQHLDEFRCRLGDEIEPGWPIGTNGTTGNVTGPHLHYELRWDNGTPLGSPAWGDPAKFTWEEDMKTYTVKRGDTLASIAKKFGITIEDLRRWNNRTPDQDRSLAIGTLLYVADPRPTPAPNSEIDKLTARVKALEDVLSTIKRALYQG